MGNHSGSLPHVSPPEQRSDPEIRIVFLVGFMGAGKTSVGQELARQLGWGFEDLDDRIQIRKGRTIEEIFRDSGESEFRRCEHIALRELLSEVEDSPRIVALGGGAFAQAENLAVLTPTGGPTVFLDAPIEELYRRCQEQQQLKRPLRQNETQFRDLYQARRSHYQKATLHVETNGKDVASLAAEVVRRLGLRVDRKSLAE